MSPAESGWETPMPSLMLTRIGAAGDPKKAESVSTFRLFDHHGLASVERKRHADDNHDRGN
jgi:hypothetical protein